MPLSSSCRPSDYKTTVMRHNPKRRVLTALIQVFLCHDCPYTDAFSISRVLICWFTFLVYSLDLLS